MMVKDARGVEITALLSSLGAREIIGRPEGVVREVVGDSRRVSPGSLFVALPGLHVDGHDFLEEARGRGALAALVERPVRHVHSLPQIVVTETRIALGVAADYVYGRPSRAIPVLAVTGTNGKTTVIHLVESIFQAAGKKCGLLGTLGYRWPGGQMNGTHTTPPADLLHRALADMVRSGVDGACMEVSSHAVALGRVAGLKLAALALTNVTRDHIDFHETEERYREEKRRLFFPDRAEKLAVVVEKAVLNGEDPVGAELASRSPLERITYGFSGEFDLHALVVNETIDGSRLRLLWCGEETEALLPLAGRYNAANALAAAGLSLLSGFSLSEVAAGLSAAKSPPGRLERVECGQPFAVIVDYAHTPDGLKRLLETLRPVTGGRLILVFGCGGERDRGKRPIMGELAGELCDLVVLTDDNPRTEDPARVRADVEEGLHRTGGEHAVVPDRREALAHALAAARTGDTVVLAGKGHEQVQIIGEEKLFWDERSVAEEILREMGYGR